MKSLQLPIYSLQDQKLLKDRQAVKNYLEHWQKMQMLCLVPSHRLNK